MAASAWIIHDDAKFKEGNKELDWDNDTFEVRLYTSASNIATTSVGDATTATNEVSGNGYAAQALTGTWTQAGATSTFDGNDVSYTASGGDIVCRYAAIIDTTLTPDLVIAHSLLDNTPADVTATDGNSLNVNMNASGIFAKS